jgi:chromosome segregation ATPase
MNKKDLQHTINQQRSKIESLENEVNRLRNDKAALNVRLAKHDADIATMRKILGPAPNTFVGGGGSGGFGTVTINS